MEKTLYHLTPKRNVKSILQNGLIPKIGSRSRRCESNPVISLTEYAFIPQWLILLGLSDPALLKITKPDLCEGAIYAGGYAEIRTEKLIEPEYISVTAMPDFDISDTMKHLCKSYIDSISDLCETCARYYTENVRTTWTKRQINTYLYGCMDTLSKLDFSILSDKEKEDYVKDIGENGMYALSDTYLNTDKRLYELSMYNDSATIKIRQNIENFIRTNFPTCLDLNTGGWNYVQ